MLVIDVLTTVSGTFAFYSPVVPYLSDIVYSVHHFVDLRNRLP